MITVFCIFVESLQRDSRALIPSSTCAHICSPLLCNTCYQTNPLFAEFLENTYFGMELNNNNYDVYTIERLLSRPTRGEPAVKVGLRSAVYLRICFWGQWKWLRAQTLWRWPTNGSRFRFRHALGLNTHKLSIFFKCEGLLSFKHLFG